MYTNQSSRWRPGRIIQTACLLVWAAAAAGSLSAATVSFQIANLGSNNFRYDYVVSGIQFQQNEEFDVRFDPTLFGTLSNGQAPPGFDVLLLQPNNPLGSPGDFSAMALVNNPSLSSGFHVTVHFLGTGTPGSQPYFINQPDANGRLLSVVDSGTTVAAGAVPEPAAWTLASAGILLGGFLSAVRAKKRGAA